VTRDQMQRQTPPDTPPRWTRSSASARRSCCARPHCTSPRAA